MTLEDRLYLFNTLMNNHLEISEDIKSDLIERGFFTAPASTRFHGNHEGGLFDHSYTVATELETITQNNSLCWERPESPYIVGMFHDLCKIDSYRHPIEPLGEGETFTDKARWEYNYDTLLKGHGIKSVMLLSKYFTLTEEEIACIVYHMGAFTDKEEWNDYTRAVRKYPNVLWTHTADMLASHVKGV